MAMEKVDAKEREKIEAVRKVMRKQAPLTSKQVCTVRALLYLSAAMSSWIVFLTPAGWLVCAQAEYCNDACVERFLRAKGDNVKKAAKNLRAVLSWRETIGAGALSPSLSLPPTCFRQQM